MNTAARIQAFLWESARLRYDAVPVPPFTLFLHPVSSVPESNYAMPDAPLAAPPVGGLGALRGAFLARGRHPRIVFVEASAPGLAAASAAAGWLEMEREQLLTATPATLRPPAPVPGLIIEMLDAHAPLEAIRENLNTNEQGFDPGAAPITEADALVFREGLTTSRAFTARLEEQAVAAGMFTTPRDGLTELAGITTLAPFRRRGIAAALTAAMAQAAFAAGLDLVFLGAREAATVRVYERVGFQPCSVLLTYSRPVLAP
jgi:ribosomal protein S18 acetylase RimI-like enzyme